MLIMLVQLALMSPVVRHMLPTPAPHSHTIGGPVRPTPRCCRRSAGRCGPARRASPVPRPGVHTLVVAVVVLQVVHAPRGEQVGVLLLVPQATGEAQPVAGLG